jgi:hypothetical protein
MANSEGRNPTESDDTTMDEFHDATHDDVTVHTGETPTLTGAEWKEIHILLEITYNNNTEARTSPQKHLLILKELGTAFDNTELEIFDNKNRKLSLEACKAMANIEHYESHFKIHQGNGRHYVIFRVLTTLRFQGIKRESAVLRILKKTGSCMKRHHWGQDKWDIVTLGFIMEMDPGRHLADEVREQVLALAKAKECETAPGSRFKFVPQRFKFKNNGTFCTADAYGVQCMQIDAQSVDTMMKNTYRDSNSYVKNKLRKENPKSYINALRVQNRYITNVKTIPIVGITKITMAEIRPILLGNPHIQHVAATNKSDSIGRWDIITDSSHQASVRQDITTNLTQWLDDATTDPEHPENFPPPGLANRGATDHETSSQGDMSYLSSSAGSYDSLIENAEDGQYDQAPTQRARNSVSVSGFSWAQVVSRTTPASQAPSHVSDLTGPTQATQQSQAVTTEMNDLKTQVQEMAGQLKRFEDLIVTLTNRLPPQTIYQGDGNTHSWTPQMSLYDHNQQQQQQWYHQQHQQHLEFQRQQSTPSRQNIARRPDPRGPQIKGNNLNQKQQRHEVQSPPKIQHANDSDIQAAPAKRSDHKSTPIKRAAQLKAPPQHETTERRLNVTNPYAQKRQVSPPPSLQPWQLPENNPDQFGHYHDGRMNSLIYSQPPGRFRYTPPSQHELEDEQAMIEQQQYQQHPPPIDTYMQDNEPDDEDQRRSAEDARQYAQL